MVTMDVSGTIIKASLFDLTRGPAQDGVLAAAVKAHCTKQRQLLQSDDKRGSMSTAAAATPLFWYRDVEAFGWVMRVLRDKGQTGAPTNNPELCRRIVGEMDYLGLNV